MLGMILETHIRNIAIKLQQTKLEMLMDIVLEIIIHSLPYSSIVQNATKSKILGI